MKKNGSKTYRFSAQLLWDTHTHRYVCICMYMYIVCAVSVHGPRVCIAAVRHSAHNIEEFGCYSLKTWLHLLVHVRTNQIRYHVYTRVRVFSLIWIRGKSTSTIEFISWIALLLSFVPDDMVVKLHKGAIILRCSLLIFETQDFGSPLFNDKSNAEK